MSRCDTELKKLKNESGAYWSDVADEMNVSEATLFRILRHKMDEATRKQITAAIMTAGRKAKA